MLYDVGLRFGGKKAMHEEIENFRVPRPWVQLAAFCQTAIQEATGALSIIRIIDRMAVAGMTQEMQPTNIQWTLAIILKADEMRGQYNLSIKIHAPNQQATDGPSFPVLFEGEDRGVQLVLPGGIVANQSGLYWFDILVENELLTRIPLRVLYQRIQMPPGGVAFPGQAGGETPSQ
jgi:hypothetical protein